MTESERQSEKCGNYVVKFICKNYKTNPEKFNVSRGYLAHHIGFEPMAFRLGVVEAGELKRQAFIDFSI